MSVRDVLKLRTVGERVLSDPVEFPHIVTRFRLEQPSKADSPMKVVSPGMLKSFNPVQPLNADAPMVCLNLPAVMLPIAGKAGSFRVGPRPVPYESCPARLILFAPGAMARCGQTSTHRWHPTHFFPSSRGCRSASSRMA